MTLQGAGPLLQGCAHKGMSATEALDKLAREHEKLFARTVMIAQLLRDSITVTDYPDPEE